MATEPDEGLHATIDDDVTDRRPCTQCGELATIRISIQEEGAVPVFVCWDCVDG